MKILLVLAGQTPDPQLFSDEVAEADLSVAVDGGSKVFRKYDQQPDLLIGDLDSSEFPFGAKIRVVHHNEQNSTDLQKTFAYLFQAHSPTQMVLLGATGKRTDHLINNLCICAAIDPKCQITLKNDQDLGNEFTLERLMRITPETDTDFGVKVGDILSIFAVSSYAGLTSSGLKWEINNASSKVGYFSQSNIAISDGLRISVATGCVYLAVYQ